jgi:iron complex outermembrane receptor protein
VFGEVMLPVTKSLELTLAARYDDYTGFGSTTNPKASLRFTPLASLLVRGSYSTGFRVPTFNQLYNGITESPYSGKDLVDPAKCASGKVDTTPGSGLRVDHPNIFTGGKPDLGPEESQDVERAASSGQPTADVSISIDWWSIKREGTIQAWPEQHGAELHAVPANFLRDANGQPGGHRHALGERRRDTHQGPGSQPARGHADRAGARWAAGLDG